MEMDCNLFVDGAASWDGLAGLVHELVGGTLDRYRWIDGDGFKLLVDENEDAWSGPRDDPDDGFLFYAHCVEVYFTSERARDGRVEFVGGLLEALWARGLRATAACAYEDELPRLGAG